MSFLSNETVRSRASGRQYRVVKVLGHGAFGEVLLAEDPETKHLFAMKQLYLRDHEQDLPQPVAREVEALQQLQHPNVVSLLDVARDGPCCYLVQELCRTDLAAVLSATNHHLPDSIVRGIMQQLLQALAAVHAHGLMHRDVKPSNVLITAAGEIKLADFGLARSSATCCSTQGASSSTTSHQQASTPHQQQNCCCKPSTTECLQPLHTGVGPQQQQRLNQLSAAAGHDARRSFQKSTEAAAVEAEQLQQQEGCLTAAQGTRWYRAPELLYGSRSYGTAVDVWAAGMVLAELLGLSPLIPGQSDIDQLARMQQTLGSITLQQWPEAGQLPDWHKISFGPNLGQPLAQLLPDAPAAALDLLAKLICYNPSQRMTAAAALQHAYFSSGGPAAADSSEMAVLVEHLLQVQQPVLRFDGTSAGESQCNMTTCPVLVSA